MTCGFKGLKDLVEWVRLSLKGRSLSLKCVLLRRVRSASPLIIENMLRNRFLMISRVQRITTHDDPDINVRSSLTV